MDAMLKIILASTTGSVIAMLIFELIKYAKDKYVTMSAVNP